MKNFFLKTGLTLLCLIIGLGSAWGETAPVNTVLWGENFAHFGTKTPSSAGTGTGTTIYDGAKITYSQSSTNTKGYNDKLAEGTAPELLLAKSNTTWTISGIKSGQAKKMSLTFLSNKTTFDLTCSESNYTVSGSEKSWVISLGEGKTAPETFSITLKNTGSSNARIDDVVLKVTEAGGVDNRTPVNMTGFSAESTTLIKGNTTATTVSNDQTGWTPSYTYSSNKENVATVADDGTITAVGKGTATITATLNIANDDANYKVGTTSSKTLEITVNNPTHTAQFSINGTIDHNNDREVEEGSDIIFPTVPDAINGKKFVGWVTAEISDTQDNEPTTLVTSANMGNADVTYYAVYATAEETELTQYTAGNTGNYVLAILNKSKWYALPNNPTVSSGKIAGVEISVATTSSSVNYVTATNAIGYTWTIANATNGQTISDGSNYIYHSNGGSSGTNLTYGNSTNYTWKIISETNGLLFKGMSGSTVNGRGMLASDTTFGGYSLTNADASEYYRIQVLPIAEASYTGYCTIVDTSTPSISADDVNVAADATSGEIEYSITNAVTGKSLSANTTADWISNIQVTADKVTFTTTANTASTERTADFTLTYDGATDKVVTVTQAGKQGDPKIENFIKTSTLELVVGAPNYDIRNCLNIPSDYDTSTYAITTTINGLTQKDGEYACVYPYIAFSKAGEYTVHVVAAAMPGKYAQTEGNITVTVTDPAPAITTIPALFTKATEVGNTKTDINLTLNSWVVSGVKGSNAYVTDGTNGFIIYQDSHGFTAGDVLSGTVACKVTLYNGSAEIVGLTSTTTGLTVSTSVEELTPTVISDLTTLSGVNTGALIKINNVQYDGTNFTDGTNSIKPYKGIMNTLPELTNSAYYNVTGVYVQYNTTKEIAPRSAEDVEEVEAEKYAINIAPCENGTVTASLEEAAAGVEVTLTVTPNSGYQLSTLAVTNASTSEEITVTSNKFIMPAAAVNVAATFEEKGAQETLYLDFDFIKHPANWPVNKDNAAAGTYTYTLDGEDYDFTMTKSGDGIYLSGASGTSGYLLMASGNQLGLPALEGYKLTQVVGQLNNSGSPSTSSIVSVTDGTNEISGGEGQTWGTKGGKYTYDLTGTEANTVYYLAVSNKNCQMINLKLTYEQASSKTLTSVTVSGTPETFTVGDEFNHNGITVMASWSEGDDTDVTSSAEFSTPDMSTAGEKAVTVSYTYGGVTKEASYNIIVNAATKYTVTIIEPENGTLVVKHGDDVVTSGAQFAVGEVLDVTATPAAGYKFRNWQAYDGTTHTFTTSFEWEMSAHDVTLTANFDEIQDYTIAWSVNGKIVKSETLEEGTEVVPVQPTDDLFTAAVPAGVTKVFTGWVTTPTVDANATPSYVTPAATATKDVTYYAVFATEEEGTGSVDKTAAFNVANYADANNWTNATAYYSAETEELRIDEGHTATTATNNGKYYTTDETWRFYKSEGGSFTVTSLKGDIKSITITFVSKDSSKKFPKLIFNEDEVTSDKEITDISSSPAVFTVGGDGGNIGIQNIEVVYVGTGTTTTYSDFTTQLFLTTITVSKYGSTTLSLDKDYTMPEGLTGKIITAKKHKENEGDGYYTLTYVTKYNAGDVVPAGEALVIQDGLTLDESRDYRVYEGTATGEVTSYPDNLLCAEYTEDANGKWLTSFNNGVDNYYYKLTTKNGANFGWYYGDTDGKPFLMSREDRAYLVIAKQIAAGIRGFALEDGEEEDLTTGIDNMETNSTNSIYNLQGLQQNTLQKGINIVNGKKVIR